MEKILIWLLNLSAFTQSLQLRDETSFISPALPLSLLCWYSLLKELLLFSHLCYLFSMGSNAPFKYCLNTEFLVHCWILLLVLHCGIWMACKWYFILPCTPPGEPMRSYFLYRQDTAWITVVKMGAFLVHRRHLEPCFL